jgi:hypothetical protein
MFDDWLVDDKVSSIKSRWSDLESNSLWTEVCVGVQACTVWSVAINCSPVATLWVLILLLLITDLITGLYIKMFNCNEIVV